MQAARRVAIRIGSPKMSPRRRALPKTASRYAIKCALMTGAALAVLWPALASAQPTPSPADSSLQSPLARSERGQILNDTGERKDQKAKPAPVNTDGLKPGELYMEADQLVRDDKNGITTAEGSVEIRYQDKTL